MSVQEDKERRPGEGEAQGGGGDTRPQQAGEAATTRFGMEDGDNTDISTTGGPQTDEEAEGGS